MDPEEEEDVTGFNGGASISTMGTATVENPTGDFTPEAAPAPAPAAAAPAPTTPHQQRAADRNPENAGERFGFVDPSRTGDPAATRAAQKALADFEAEAQREYSMNGNATAHEYMMERSGNRSDFQGGWGGSTMGLATGGQSHQLPGSAGSPYAPSAPRGGGGYGAASPADIAALGGQRVGGWQSSGGLGMVGGPTANGGRQTTFANGGTGSVLAPGSFHPNPASNAPPIDRGYQEWMGAGGSGRREDWNAHAQATGQGPVGQFTPASAPLPSAAAPAARPAAPAAPAQRGPSRGPNGEHEMPGQFTPGFVFDPTTGQYVLE